MLHRRGGRGKFNGARPKVLHIITGLGTGGAEHCLVKLLSGDKEASYDSLVVSLRGRERLTSLIEDLGIEVHGLGMRDVV